MAARAHRVLRRRRRRARHAALRRPAGACASRSRSRSGSLDGAAASGRFGVALDARLGRRRPAGGGASAISSPGCGGSARPSWSRPTSSPGRCRSACSACRPSSPSFPALGFALARALLVARARRGSSPSPSAWPSSEWLRGHLFTGFPWNTLGMALGQNLWLMQSASVVGLYGLTVLAVLICAAPATLGTGDDGRAGAGRRRRSRARRPRARSRASAPGACRPRPTPTVAGVKLRIMQPNLPQDAKFNPANRDAIMRRYLALSDRADLADVERRRRRHASDLARIGLSLPASPRRPRARRRSRRCCRPASRSITGAARADEPLPGEERAALLQRRSRSSRDDGASSASYDKAHLVPVRRVPAAFPRRRCCAASACASSSMCRAASTPARAAKPLAVPGLPPVAPTICYEAIFPGGVVLRGHPAGPDPERDQRCLVRHHARSRTSISPRRACGPSRRACRSSAPPTPASRRWSTPTAGSLGALAARRRRRARRGACRPQSGPHLLRNLGRILFATMLLCCACFGLARAPKAADRPENDGWPVKRPADRAANGSSDDHEGAQPGRPACRKPRAHAAHADRHEPGEARRGARPDLPAGPEIREGHEPDRREPPAADRRACSAFRSSSSSRARRRLGTVGGLRRGAVLAATSPTSSRPPKGSSSIKAFVGIKDAKVRRRIVDLAKALANGEERVTA